MIINGKNRVGLYKYNSDSIFTEGDIVYKDSTLYIALTEVSGIDPSDELMSKGKYVVYLGDKCTSLDDYLNYEKTEDSSKDKYIPADLLPVILNHYLTGVNEKGIISSQSSSADEILVSENINNAIYSVDRDLDGLPIDLYSKSSGRLNPEKLILKQYTYLEKTFVDSVQVSNRVRVQELIDHSQYMVWYRYKKIDDPSSTASDWKSITMNSSNIHENILKLASTYKSMIDSLRSTITNLKSNFRFKSIDIPNGKNNYFIIPEDYKESKMTITVMLRSGNGIYTSIDFTINLKSSIKKYESNGCYLMVNDDRIELFEDKDMSVPNRKAFINDIYIHEYYG